VSTSVAGDPETRPSGVPAKRATIAGMMSTVWWALADSGIRLRRSLLHVLSYPVQTLLIIGTPVVGCCCSSSFSAAPSKLVG
jgi:hypothetical protein